MQGCDADSNGQPFIRQHRTHYPEQKVQNEDWTILDFSRLVEAPRRTPKFVRCMHVQRAMLHFFYTPLSLNESIALIPSASSLPATNMPRAHRDDPDAFAAETRGGRTQQKLCQIRDTYTAVNAAMSDMRRGKHISSLVCITRAMTDHQVRDVLRVCDARTARIVNV